MHGQCGSGINGMAITAPSMNRTNLAPINQTKEVIAKRLHDGIDDTFVSRTQAFGLRWWAGFQSTGAARSRASYGASAIGSTATDLKRRRYHGPIDPCLRSWSTTSRE